MEKVSLLQEIQSCRLCESILPLEPRPVLQFHPEARILIAGQAPGIRVHETGIPFNDPSGERLRDWLGVSREQFYDEKTFAIVPMAFCYPGTGKSGDLPPPKTCAQHWRQRILAALPNLELTLAIGAYAQKYHFPKDKRSLTQLLQDYLKKPEEFGSCLPLPHPSPRNNIWLKKNPWFEKDLLPRVHERVQGLIKAPS